MHLVSTLGFFCSSKLKAVEDTSLLSENLKQDLPYYFPNNTSFSCGTKSIFLIFFLYVAGVCVCTCMPADVQKSPF